MNYSKIFNNVTEIYGNISSSLPKGFALPPIHTIIEVTYKCNLNCKMCYLQDIRKSKSFLNQPDLTTQEIKKIIDWMLPKTVITFSGGELFVRKDALELIKYSSKNHFCNFVTNAVLINKKIAKLLVDSKVSLVGISIDGIGKTHDEIRRVNNTYKKAIESIKLIQKEKKEKNSIYPLIDLKTVLLKENTDQIIQIYNLAKELNIDYLTLSVIKPENGAVMPPLFESISKKEYFRYPKIYQNLKYEKIMKQLYEIRKTGNKKPFLRFYPENIDRHFKEYYTNKLSSKNYAKCTLPWRTLRVNPYGDIFPCFPLKVGNIKEKSLSQIWNGKKFRKFRKDFKKYGIYPGCNGCCNATLVDIPNSKNTG